MKKFLKFLAIMAMGIVFVACGNNNIDKIKGAYKGQKSESRPVLEWVVNSARICGSNKYSNFREFYSNFDDFISYNSEFEYTLKPIANSMQNIKNVEECGTVIKLFKRITLNPKDVRSMGNILLGSGIVLPKSGNIDTFDWWEFEKDGTKYVATGEKNRGYVVFKILNDGKEFINYSVCCKNIETGEMEEALFSQLDDIENLVESLIMALLTYDLDDGAIEKDLEE